MTTYRPPRVLILVAGLLACSCVAVRAQREDEAVSNALTAVDIIRLGDPDDDMIVGEAGNDYPTYAEVPNTAFSCRQQGFPGYYADQEAECQVFHICVTQGRRLEQFSFLCPNGTIFNQQYLVCVWWYEFDCAQAPSLYRVNADIFGDAGAAPAIGDAPGTGAASAQRGQPASARFPGTQQGPRSQGGLSGNGNRAGSSAGLPSAVRGQGIGSNRPGSGDGQRTVGGFPSLARGSEAAGALPSQVSGLGVAGGLPSQTGGLGATGGLPSNAGSFGGVDRPATAGRFPSTAGRPGAVGDRPFSAGSPDARGSGRPSALGTGSVATGLSGGSATPGTFPTSIDGSSEGKLPSPGVRRPSTSGTPSTSGGFIAPSRGSSAGQLGGSARRPSKLGGSTDSSNVPGTTGVPGITGGISNTASRPSITGGFSGTSGRPVTSGGLFGTQDSPITTGGLRSSNQPGSTAFSGSTGRPVTSGGSGSLESGSRVTDGSTGIVETPTAGFTGSQPVVTGGLSGFRPSTTGLSRVPSTTGGFPSSTDGLSGSVNTPGTTGGLTGLADVPSSSGGLAGFADGPNTSGGFVSSDGAPVTGGLSGPVAGLGITGSNTGLAGQPGAIGGVATGTTGGITDSTGIPLVPGERFVTSAGRPDASGSVGGKPATTGGFTGTDAGFPGPAQKPGITRGTTSLVSDLGTITSPSGTPADQSSLNRFPDTGISSTTGQLPLNDDTRGGQIGSGVRPALSEVLQAPGDEYSLAGQFPGTNNGITGGVTQGALPLNTVTGSEGTGVINQGQFISQQEQTGPEYGQGQNEFAQGQTGLGQGLDQTSFSFTPTQGDFVVGSTRPNQGFEGQLQGQGGLTQDLGLGQGGSVQTPGQIQSGVNQPGLISGQAVTGQEQYGLTQDQAGFVSGQGQEQTDLSFGQIGQDLGQVDIRFNEGDGSFSSTPVQNQINEGYSYPAPATSLTLGQGVSDVSAIQNINDEGIIFTTQNQGSQTSSQNNNNLGNNINTPELNTFQSTVNIIDNNILNSQGSVSSQPIQGSNEYQNTQITGSSFSNGNNGGNEIFVVQDSGSGAVQFQSNQNQFVSNTGDGIPGDSQITQGYTYNTPSTSSVTGSNSFLGNTNGFQTHTSNNISPGQLSNNAGTSFTGSPEAGTGSFNLGGSSVTFGSTDSGQNIILGQTSISDISDLVSVNDISTGNGFETNTNIVNNASPVDITQQLLQYSLPSKEFSPSGSNLEDNEPVIIQQPRDELFVTNLPSTSLASLTNNLKQEFIAPVKQAEPTFIFRAPLNSVSTIDLSALQQGYLPPVNSVSQNQGSSSVSSPGSSSSFSFPSQPSPSLNLPSSSSSASATQDSPSPNLSTLTSFSSSNQGGSSAGQTSITFVTGAQPSGSSTSSEPSSITFLTGSQTPASGISTGSSSGSLSSNPAIGFSSSVSQDSSTGPQIFPSSLPLSSTFGTSNANSGVDSVQNPLPSLDLGYLPPVADAKRNTRHVGRGERKIFVTPLPKEDQTQSASVQQSTGRRSFKPSLQLTDEEKTSEFVPRSASKRFGRVFFPSSRRSDGQPITYVDNTRRSFVAMSSSPVNPYNKYSLSWRS